MVNYGIGVWIDKRNAFIVQPSEDGCNVVTVISEVEGHRKSTGGKGKSQPYMHETGPSSSSHRERADENAMKKYLAEVERCLEGASKIFLLGPGETKIALRNLLVANATLHQKREIALEAAEQMSEAQLKATVLSHFGHAPERVLLRGLTQSTQR
jgi:hypothetical protein